MLYITDLWFCKKIILMYSIVKSSQHICIYVHIPVKTQQSLMFLQYYYRHLAYYINVLQSLLFKIFCQFLNHGKHYHSFYYTFTCIVPLKYSLGFLYHLLSFQNQLHQYLAQESVSTQSKVAWFIVKFLTYINVGNYLLKHRSQIFFITFQLIFNPINCFL